MSSRLMFHRGCLPCSRRPLDSNTRVLWECLKAVRRDVADKWSDHLKAKRHSKNKICRTSVSKDVNQMLSLTTTERRFSISLSDLPEAPALFAVGLIALLPRIAVKAPGTFDLPGDDVVLPKIQFQIPQMHHLEHTLQRFMSPQQVCSHHNPTYSDDTSNGPFKGCGWQTWLTPLCFSKSLCILRWTPHNSKRLTLMQCAWLKSKVRMSCCHSETLSSGRKRYPSSEPNVSVYQCVYLWTRDKFDHRL